jgi:hypothetical protein
MLHVTDLIGGSIFLDVNFRSGDRRVVGLETFLEGARGEGWIVMISIACVFKKVYETTAQR